MNPGKLNLFHFAKLTNNELLLEGLLQTKGLYQVKFLEKYKKKPNHFKIKVIATKILYSLIFGVLPLLPILTYFQIVNTLITGLIPVENIILTGSVFFGLYFALQFFNFFLMCILESGMIMSGSIFAWFKTLPISREKLSKLAYFTMFRSFDIPIIVIILGFPITMLIGTQNLIIFFVCLGISILNIILSFDIVILLGKRLNRILESNASRSRKSLTVRLINIFSYVFIILGSIYVIQWAFGNIETIFLFVIGFEQPAFLNLILSIIPYPFNPSFLVSLVIIPMEITVTLWVSTIIGLGLFILLTWWIHTKAAKILDKITYQESVNVKKNLVEDEIQVKIKTHSPLSAFIRKDLLIATRDLKTFMAIIMPIILSCIFTFSFNFGNIGDAIVIERDVIFYGVSILIFCPIISYMLVYGIFNIEVSGESVTASLPINPREQAKAKIILLIIFQSLAVFAPLLLYITNSKLTIFLIVSLISLPFTWIILISTFEMKILFFGKFRNRYKIEDINPENRTFKWALIISIEYIIAFWLISFLLILPITIYLLLFYIVATLVGIIGVIVIFDRTLPIIPEIGRISKGKQTIFTQHSWLSIILLMISYSFTVYVSTFFLNLIRPFEYYPLYPTNEGNNEIRLIVLILFNLSYIPLLIILIPKIFGLPYGIKSIKKYLEDINIGWIKPLLKYLLWGSIGILGFYFVGLLIGLISGFINFFPIRISFEIFRWLIEFCYIFWQEFFFRGVILTILLNRRSKLKSIFLNALLYLTFSIVTMLISFPSIGIFSIDLLLAIIPSLIYYFIVGIFLAYLCVKTNSIIPGILTQIIAFTIGIGLPSLPIFFILYF